MFSTTRTTVLPLKRLLLWPSTSCPRFSSKPPTKTPARKSDLLSERTLMHIDAQFRRVPPEDRNKKTFHAAISMFISNRGGNTRGYVEFLNTAMNHLVEYGVHKDLETYKALLNVFPKGPLIPTNQFQKAFKHYPLQQDTAVAILDEMEWHGVFPDKEVLDIMTNIFGGWNWATKKIRRQLYWLPKLRYLNKYLDRRLVEFKNLDGIELARIALKMMSRDPGVDFSYIKSIPKPESEIEDDPDAQKEQMLHTNWIVSAQSPLQRELIKNLPENSCLYVDGPKVVWVMNHKIKYVVLTTDPCPDLKDEFIEKRDLYDFTKASTQLYEDTLENEPNVHQQLDMTILALAVLENNEEPVAKAWINHLISKNPRISELRLLIRLKEEDFLKNLYSDELREAEEEERQKLRY